MLQTSKQTAADLRDLEIRKVGEQFIEGHFEHCLSVRATVLVNLLTEIAVSKKSKKLSEFRLLELSAIIAPFALSGDSCFDVAD